MNFCARLALDSSTDRNRIAIDDCIAANVDTAKDGNNTLIRYPVYIYVAKDCDYISLSVAINGCGTENSDDILGLFVRAQFRVASDLNEILAMNQGIFRDGG